MQRAAEQFLIAGQTDRTFDMHKLARVFSGELPSNKQQNVNKSDLRALSVD